MADSFKKIVVPDEWYSTWSSYPSGFTPLEMLIDWVSKVNDLTENVNNWNIYLENFVETFDEKLEPTVIATLREMEADGTLANIINEVLFSDIDTRLTNLETSIDSRFESVDLEKVSIDDLPYIDVVKYAERYSLTITDAFQQCLDVANVGPGVTVVIPAGTSIDLTKELKVYANTTILSGENVTIRRMHNGYILVNGNRETEDNPTLYGGYNGRGNIHIKGGTWDGNGVAFPSKASIFHFAHGDNISVTDATLKDPANSHHIEFNACRNVRVDNCRFLGWVGTTDTFNEAIQLDVAKLNVTNIGLDDGTPCENVWITDCYFGDSGTSGSNSIARGIGAHNATSRKIQRNINIINCVFEDTLDWAIRSYNWENVTISGNTFNDCGAGINVRASITGVDTEDANGVQVGADPLDGFNISDNVFHEAEGDGRLIEIYGEEGTDGVISGVAVSDNVIYMVGAVDSYDAINFHYTRHSTCTGNRISNTKGNGIQINADSRHITVMGNELVGVGESGVYVLQSHYISVVGNIFNQIGQNAIYFGEVIGLVATGNIISGVNGVVDDTDDFNHVRVVSGCELGVISGNVCRNYGTVYVTPRAIYVTNTCRNIRVTDNVAIGYEIFANPVNGTLDADGNMT